MIHQFRGIKCTKNFIKLLEFCEFIAKALTVLSCGYDRSAGMVWRVLRCNDERSSPLSGRKNFHLRATHIEHAKTEKRAEGINDKIVEVNSDRALLHERIKDAVRYERQNNAEKGPVTESPLGIDSRQRRLTQEEKMALRKQIRDARRDIYLQKMEPRQDQKPTQN